MEDLKQLPSTATAGDNGGEKSKKEQLAEARARANAWHDRRAGGAAIAATKMVHRRESIDQEPMSPGTISARQERLLKRRVTIWPPVARSRRTPSPDSGRVDEEAESLRSQQANLQWAESLRNSATNHADADAGSGGGRKATAVKSNWTNADFARVLAAKICIALGLAIEIVCFALLVSAYPTFLRDFIAHLYCIAIGLQFIEALKHKQDQGEYKRKVTQCLAFSVLWAFFSRILQPFESVLVHFFPFYQVFKHGVLLWAMLPQTEGATVLYNFLRVSRDFLSYRSSRVGQESIGGE